MSNQVHRVRFYNLEPNPIKCMSLEKKYQLLAISRIDNSIEIWNISYTPHIETTIFSTFGTIEGLSWYNRRLFSVGLQGSIIEYDLFKQEPKSMHPISSSGCWCLAVHHNNKQLAAGTNDGYINIFDIHLKELVYNKMLDKQEGRIYCIAWHSSGEYLITGSVNTIRIWKVSTGNAIHRLLTGKDNNRKDTIVWTLTVSDDFTIISGDSRGKLCFWDGNAGISITSYQSHKADILSVCLDDEQNIVYCAGVDPLIATYERVKMRGNDEHVKWIKSVQRIIHDHDVRCLIVNGNKLYSAGIDGYLALSSYPPKVLIKYPPLLQPPCVQLSSELKLILLRFPNSVVIWQLSIGKIPTKLIDWRPPGGGLRVKTASISENGKWFCCSTQEKLFLYSLKFSNKKPELNKIKLHTKKNLASNYILFSKNSKTLVLGTLGSKICVIDLEKEMPSLKYIIRPHKDKYSVDNLNCMAISENAEYIVAADLSRNIIVWTDGMFYCKLPVYQCPITTMAIQPSTNYLIVAYADHQIIEYALESKKYTEFSRQLQSYQLKSSVNRNFIIHSITFNKSNPDILLLSDDSSILFINKQKDLPSNNTKVPRLISNNYNNNIQQTTIDTSESVGGSPASQITDSALHLIKLYKHLVFFGKFSDEEMVAVEICPIQFKEKLPLTSRKLFGRM